MAGEAFPGAMFEIRLSEEAIKIGSTASIEKRNLRQLN
jgi:hypothetical protein